MIGLAEARLIRSAHDCSDGGIAVTLAECCFDTGGVGAEVSLEAVAVSAKPAVNDAAALFGESASRVVVSATLNDVADVLDRAAAAGVPARVVGQTGGSQLRVAVGGRTVIDVTIDDAERTWSTAVANRFTRRVA